MIKFVDLVAFYLLYLFCASGKVECIRKNASDSKIRHLYFDSNGGGLFSQFLQMKIMHQKALNLNSTLVLIPFSSKEHYGNKVLNMCRIFVLPTSIICGRPPKTLDCKNNWPVDVFKDRNEFCYGGPITNASNARPYIVRAVSYNLPLIFTDIALAYWPSFTAILGAALTPNLFEHFTVVHWRRGDQLTSRCGRLDTSVNCGTAWDLMAHVNNSLARNDLIYIATNEKASSKHIKTLRSHGYLTFSDLMISTGNDSSPNVFQILAMEVQLMLVAETFLAWGISEIDDVVEHERMMRNKSFCFNRNYLPESWCAYADRSKILKNKAPSKLDRHQTKQKHPTTHKKPNEK